MRAADDRRGASDAPATMLVAIVWLALTVLAIDYVRRYATPVAFLDDLFLVDRLGPRARIDAAWLWVQHNEHRIPLPKLVWYALVKSTHDLRAGAYFDVVLLSLLALWTMAVARAVRGRTSVADLLFPLVLLSWGNSENLLNSFQVCLIVPVFLLSAILLVIVRSVRHGSQALAQAGMISPATSLSIGACLLMMPLCGVVGITFAAPLLVWFAAVACSAWRGNSPNARGAAAIAFAATASTIALIASTFYNFKFLPGFEHAGALRALETTAQVASESLGWMGQSWWPFSALLAVALIVAIVVVLLRAVVRAAGQHASGDLARASGLLACTLSVLALALSIGWGRGNDGPTAGFCNRYEILGAPLYVIAACCAALYLRPALERRVRWSLLAAWLTLWIVNVTPAVEYGTTRKLQGDALIEDARAGLAPAELAARHWRNFCGESEFTEQLECLKTARFAPFAKR